MEIPNRFQILGHTIEVEMRDDLVEEHEAVGLTEWKRSSILLQKATSDYDQTASYIGHTFCHELVHCLLFAMAEDKLSRDERFVDRLGGLLHQALMSFEYDIEEEEEDGEHGTCPPDCQSGS